VANVNKRVCIDGTTSAGSILIDGKLFCSLHPTIEEQLNSKPASNEAVREMKMLHCVADALEKFLEEESNASRT
jgi:hypothetical protein